MNYFLQLTFIILLSLSALKQEVQHLKSLLQIEQSIHQAIQKQVPKVITSKDVTIDELKEFDKIAQEYEETMKESLILKDHLDLADMATLEELGSGIR